MIAPIRIRSVTGRRVAFSVWLLPGGEVRLQRETPEAHAAQAWTEPQPGAVWCLSWSTYELNTADGLPHPGDVWEQHDTADGLPASGSKARVVVCTGDGFDFNFHHEESIAGTRLYAGFRFQSRGHLLGSIEDGKSLTRADFLSWRQEDLTLRVRVRGVEITDGVLTVDDVRITKPTVQRTFRGDR